LKEDNRARVVDPAKEVKPKESAVQKANKYFNLAFYVYFFNSLLMDVVMAAFVNLFFMGYGGFMAIFHHFVSVVALVLFLGLVYKTLSIMINLERKRRDKVDGTHVKTKFKKWLFLRVPIKEDAKLLPRFVPEGYMVHDVMLCFFLVTFNSMGMVQIVSLFLMKVYLLVNLCFKPLKEKLEQIMLIGNEIFFVVILILFMVIDTQGDSITLDQLRGTYGNTIILFYIAILSFNCVIGSISTYNSVKEICKKKKMEKDSKAGGLGEVIKRRNQVARQKKATTQNTAMGGTEHSTNLTAKEQMMLDIKKLQLD
jgi:hypothetical protein